MPLNTSITVTVARSGDNTALPKFLLFPLVLAHTSSISYPLIFHTAGSAEGIQHTAAVWLMPSAGSMCPPHHERLSQHLSKPATSIVSATQSVPSHPELLHIQSISSFSTTSYFQTHFCLELEHPEKGQCPCYSFWPEAKEKWLFDNSSNSVWTRELYCGIVPGYNASFQ